MMDQSDRHGIILQDIDHVYDRPTGTPTPNAPHIRKRLTNSGTCGCNITTTITDPTPTPPPTANPTGSPTPSGPDIDNVRETTYPDGTYVKTEIAIDPRWDTIVKYPSSITITTGTTDPKTATITTSRESTLSDSNDPMTLTGQTETVTINNRTYTSVFDGLSSPKTITDTTPEGRTMTSTLNSAGRVATITIPGLVPITYDYFTTGPHIGKLSQIAQGQNRTYTFDYDDYGHLETVTDPLGQSINLTNDEVGRTIKQIFPYDANRPSEDPVTTDEREINLGYNDNGSVTMVQPPGMPEHEFDFTPISLVQNYFPPDVIDGTHQTHYSYNYDRQLEQVQRPYYSTETPADQRMDLAYDSTTGRLDTVTVPGRDTITYGYNTGNGQLTSIITPGTDSTTLSYTYDGALLTGTAWTGAVQGSIQKSYNNDFDLATIKVNNDDTTKATLVYDDDGLLETIQLGEPPVNLLTVSRDTGSGTEKNGLITGTTLGNISDTIGYDDAWSNNYGEVNAYNAKYNSTDLIDIAYVRDDTGRISQKTETVGGLTTTYQYFYYKRGWLKKVIKTGATTTVTEYEYDDNGNRTVYKVDGNTVATGIYDDQDRLIQYGDYIFTYTANGELYTKTDTGPEPDEVTTYSYDAFGNLIQVDLPNGAYIDYIIDGQNRRVGKKVNGSVVRKYIYAGQLHPIAELDASDNLVSLFGPGFMIKSGTVYRLIRDHLGGIRQVVNKDTGDIVQRIDYDEFGNIILDTNPGFQPLGFACGLYDPDTGLVRFGFRDYEPITGRWTSKDPIIFYGKTTNLFGYVMNDPINLIDKYGLLQVSSFIEKNFPTVVDRIRTIETRLTEKKYDAYKEYGQASKKDVKKAMKWGEGPLIEVNWDLSICEMGHYNKNNPNQIDINGGLLNKYKYGTEDQKRYAEKIIDRTLEHELVHYFDWKDGERYNSSDPGEDYELDVYGEKGGKCLNEY
ncbi:hypothetical protein JXQ70_10225 [bacterium]|nr:hypothetical protein [bacterium]